MTPASSAPQTTPCDGGASYDLWRDELRAHPDYQATYEEESAKGDLWLQLVEAREAAGLSRADLAERLGVSQARVARIERRGYDACTLETLRRYVQALGDGFRLDVIVRHGESQRRNGSSVAA